MENKYVEDLKDIKDIMNRSSRFSTLSGLSGITVGIAAVISAYLSYEFVFKQEDYLVLDKVGLSGAELAELLIIAGATIILSIGLVLGLTYLKTKKQNSMIWDLTARRILFNLAIPLFTGGLICLILLFNGYLGLTLSLSMVFYGLALVNVSKFTLDELRSLGLFEILLGILALLFTNLGLIIWTLGFGFLHIIYGFIVKAKR